MMREYAVGQGSKLLRRLAARVGRAASSHDPDSIHDVRVAIRRFQQFLRVFHQFLPRANAKKVRHQLREIMQLSGEVRNRDIAAALIKQAGRQVPERLLIRLARQRRQAHAALLRRLDRLHERGVAQKWHSKLHL